MVILNAARTIAAATLAAIVVAGPASAQTYGGCSGGMMGPGMMGPGMATYGHGWMGPNVMWSYGPAGVRTPPRNLNLTVSDVSQYFTRWLNAQGNPHLRLGNVKANDADTILVDIVTTSAASLVARYEVNRHTGYMRLFG